MNERNTCEHFRLLSLSFEGDAWKFYVLKVWPSPVHNVKVTSRVYPNYWIDGDPRTRQSDQWWQDKYVRECSHLPEQAFSQKQSCYMNLVTYPMRASSWWRVLPPEWTATTASPSSTSSTCFFPQTLWDWRSLFAVTTAAEILTGN